MLLPMMRQQKIEMWIVTNEEFHADPVTAHIAPPLPYVGQRDFFIFADRGGDKLDRIAVVRYAEEHLKYFFELLNPPGREIAATLRRVMRGPAARRLFVIGSFLLLLASPSLSYSQKPTEALPKLLPLRE